MRNMQKSVTFSSKERYLVEKAADKIGLNYCSFIRMSCLEKAEKILGVDNEK